MKMSWFFGKKKQQRESPPETPDEAAPAPMDGYIIVEKEKNAPPSSNNIVGIYPNLGDPGASYMAYNPTIPQHQLASGDSQNYLYGISLKLSKNFDNDFEIDRLRNDEIMSFILSVQNEDYNYDFSLERSVINEMESGA